MKSSHPDKSESKINPEDVSTIDLVFARIGGSLSAIQEEHKDQLFCLVEAEADALEAYRNGISFNGIQQGRGYTVVPYAVELGLMLAREATDSFLKSLTVA